MMAWGTFGLDKINLKEYDDNTRPWIKNATVMKDKEVLIKDQSLTIGNKVEVHAISPPPL